LLFSFSAIETAFPGIWTQICFCPKKKPDSLLWPWRWSLSVVRLSWIRGYATFCPYFTIGLAFLFFWAVKHKMNQITT